MYREGLDPGILTSSLRETLITHEANKPKKKCGLYKLVSLITLEVFYLFTSGHVLTNYRIK